MFSWGGYHTDSKMSNWPVGSIWESEGQRLYEIVREANPNLVVEIGAFHGCSTTWICQALIHNEKGKLISIDNSTFGVAWDLVPKWCNTVLEKWDVNCFECEVPENIDILFEDGDHSETFTQRALERFPAKIVVCHDYLHPTVGKNIQRGFKSVLGEPDEVFIEPPSDCGLGIKWIK